MNTVNTSFHVGGPSAFLAHFYQKLQDLFAAGLPSKSTKLVSPTQLLPHTLTVEFLEMLAKREEKKYLIFSITASCCPCLATLKQDDGFINHS